MPLHPDRLSSVISQNDSKKSQNSCFSHIKVLKDVKISYQQGATTLRIMTLSITVVFVMWNAVMLNVANNPFILSAIMLNVVMPSVVAL